MKVFIKGASPKLEKGIRNIIEWFAKRHGLDTKDFFLLIDYVPVWETASHGAFGWVDGVTKFEKNKPIKMTLGDGVAVDHGFEGLVQILIHEMVHVKQIIFDGMRDFMGMTTFKGKTYTQMETINSPDSPWEQEAYGTYPYVVRLYLNTHKSLVDSFKRDDLVSIRRKMIEKTWLYKIYRMGERVSIFNWYISLVILSSLVGYGVGRLLSLLY